MSTLTGSQNEKERKRENTNLHNANDHQDFSSNLMRLSEWHVWLWEQRIKCRKSYFENQLNQIHETMQWTAFANWSWDGSEITSTASQSFLCYSPERLEWNWSAITAQSLTSTAICLVLINVVANCRLLPGSILFYRFPFHLSIVGCCSLKFFPSFYPSSFQSFADRITCDDWSFNIIFLVCNHASSNGSIWIEMHAIPISILFPLAFKSLRTQRGKINF